MMMSPQYTQETLNKLGVSAVIVTGLMVIMMGAFIYRSHLETKKIKLEIKKLNKEGFE